MKTKTTLTLMAGLTGLLALPMSAQENTPPAGAVETAKPTPDPAPPHEGEMPRSGPTGFGGSSGSASIGGAGGSIGFGGSGGSGGFGGSGGAGIDMDAIRKIQEAANMIDPMVLSQIAGDPSVRGAVAAALGPKGTVSWTAVNGGDMIHERLNRGPVTFLGVMTTQVSPEISTHLALEENTGLVVEYVDKDGPAGKAGLEKGDILTKLDDQILILPQQLRVLVENKKEGDAIKLSILRKGKTEEVTVTLVKKEPSAEPKNGTFRLGGVDVVIDAEEGRPLRTFLKHLTPPPGAPAPPMPPAPPAAHHAKEAGQAAKPAEEFEKPELSVEDRLGRIEAMLEKLASEKK